MVPVGTILPYGGDVLDGRVIDKLKAEGWLPCDGRGVGREEYKKLFDVIGVAFGYGDQETKFNLPDLRGRFLRGVDMECEEKADWRDPEHDTRPASAKGGNKENRVGSVQEDALVEHTHPYKTNIWYDWEEKQGDTYLRGDNSTNSLHNGITAINSGKQETRPKNIYVNFIIKAL